VPHYRDTTENRLEPPNQWKISHVISAVLNLIALSALILSALSEAPPKKATGALIGPYRKITTDQALSLYTFYEGRVQSTKSILVGILAGILSLR
jgi:hypothetical protein